MGWAAMPERARDSTAHHFGLRSGLAGRAAPETAVDSAGAKKPKRERKDQTEQEPEPALDLLKTAEATHGSPEFGAQRVWQRGGAGSHRDIPQPPRQGSEGRGDGAAGRAARGGQEHNQLWSAPGCLHQPLELMANKRDGLWRTKEDNLAFFHFRFSLASSSLLAAARRRRPGRPACPRASPRVTGSSAATAARPAGFPPQQCSYTR